MHHMNERSFMHHMNELGIYAPPVSSSQPQVHSVWGQAPAWSNPERVDHVAFPQAGSHDPVLPPDVDWTLDLGLL